jgi:hypothetical protein
LASRETPSARQACRDLRVRARWFPRLCRHI